MIMSTAVYEANKRVHYKVTLQDERGEYETFKLFYPADECTGGDSPILNAKQGTVVSVHFTPVNDIAREDRAMQMADPGKYVKTVDDIGLLAEILVHSGWYQDEYKDMRDGRRKLIRTAKNVAMQAIRDYLGEDVVRKLRAGDDIETATTKLQAIEALKKLGSDETETRKALVKMLRDGGITKGYFPGAPVEKLAEFVWENGLFKG